MQNSFVIFSVLLFSVSARADASFDTVWSAISSGAPALESERREKEALEIQKSRANAHWAPRLVASAGVFSTNSPSTTLFSQLGARSLQASDLNPSVMNDPSREWFKQGQLSLVLPIFEGGSSRASAQGAGYLLESRGLEVQAAEREIYSQVVRDFAIWSNLKSEVQAILELQAKLQGILERYRLASRDNPVGYSGWLGMKSLENRLQGIVARAQIEMRAIEIRLSEQSGMPQLSAQGLQSVDAIGFIDQKFQESTRSNQEDYRSQAFRLSARAQESYAQSEKSRWLPQVGIYASGQWMQSPRDSGTSSEYGAYLQWSLFDARQIGAYRQARLHAQSVQAKSQEIAQNSRAERRALENAIPLIRENLTRLRDSSRLLREQIFVTERLFRTGSVNALQLSDVLSRRVDVIDQEGQLVSELIRQQAQLFVLLGGSRE